MTFLANKLRRNMASVAYAAANSDDIPTVPTSPPINSDYIIMNYTSRGYCGYSKDELMRRKAEEKAEYKRFTSLPTNRRRKK